jgi:lipopolysaccharide/colanic/teichoic acid biosynthesis glycosyltransferase
MKPVSHLLPWEDRSFAQRRDDTEVSLATADVCPLSGYDYLKRVVDIVGAVALGVTLSPVMLGVAIAVRMSSPGPVIFRQRRLTEGGREFMLCKFRTMRQDAERETGAVVAQLHDLRVTGTGKFLRKTRLDELPQLWNVVRGEMSLIGPRPERPELAKNFERKIKGFHRRLGVKAGLTGLAQVIQGYPEYTDGYRQKLALDILYIKKKSILLDMWIALKTVGVVLSGSGAR